ncbi:MAG TPA: DUF2231 domain-containing protein [Dongiaceae bacterium]|nr:DUF2231 domain-containing protein [Dongiaceae bacterium]
MLNPFDPKAALLAKHAQHVVLIHFPIALYLTGTLFDLAARVFRKPALAAAARWNFLVAAPASLAAAASGLLAWRFALAGQTIKGLLLWHLVLGLATVAALWLTFLVRVRNRPPDALPPSFLVGFELTACAVVAVTAHLGGFLSGVNFG